MDKRDFQDYGEVSPRAKKTSNSPVYITLDLKPKDWGPEFFASNIERPVTNNFHTLIA